MKDWPVHKTITKVKTFLVCKKVKHKKNIAQCSLQKKHIFIKQFVQILILETGIGASFYTRLVKNY